MELIIKTFHQLTVEELFEIYKLRISVFVVEQNCPYQDIDEADKTAIHLYLKDKDGIQAYARVLPAGTVFEEVSLGRVIAKKRRIGLGTKIVSAAIDTAYARFHATSIKIEAQVYAKGLYEKLGFQQKSEPFLEDGIPHILMELKKKAMN